MGIIDDGARRFPGTALAALTVLITASTQVPAAEQASAAPASPAAVRYSPNAGDARPTRVFWGDTHNHTSNSGDAFTAGNRLTPEMAYRFARGEEVISSTGVAARLSRALDFLVVSDHAEGLGLMNEVMAGNPAMMADATIARWKKGLEAGGREALLTKNELVSAQAQGTLPAPLVDPKVVQPAMRSVWLAYTETAERFNEPGLFTAMIGYEWTSVPGGNNLHRNVLFRDGKDKADQVVPFSAWQSEDPEKLWAWMAAYEQKTGGRVLAIPHNANVSNGRMFELTDFAGQPLDRDYAERRARFEVLQEIVQTKGNSETHPDFSPNDEFAGDMGIAGWEYGNLTLEDQPATPAMRATGTLRAGLMRGLEQEALLGVNPFKFGVLGSSDTHITLTAIEENNYFGKEAFEEPAPGRYAHSIKKGFGKERFVWQTLAAGYAAVWATANTREALWDAMARREVYGTSGSRITLRFFGGWEFASADATAGQLADAGYAKGVPMGGELRTAPKGKAPSFLVAALKDPLSGNLDRIQIVKGWLDASGKARERIYDVAWSDPGKRTVRGGRLTPVGTTLDVATATWRDSIGAAELHAVWTDPEFDADTRAFYYARVLEIPTPRWTSYDAARFGDSMPPEVPMTQQERAWSSSIWYTP